MVKEDFNSVNQLSILCELQAKKYVGCKLIFICQFDLSNNLEKQIDKNINIKKQVLYHSSKWYSIYKDKNKTLKSKNLSLANLINWYSSFQRQYSQLLSTIVDPSLLSKKELKEQKKKNHRKQNDPKFLQAIQQQNHELVEYLLLNNEANIEAFDVEQQSRRASHYACKLGDLRLCQILDKYDCDWEAEDHDQHTPIFYAITSDNIAIVQFLAEEKMVNINHSECQGRTPFYLACSLLNMQIIDYLYKKGADINIVSSLKRCPLSKACYLGHTKIVQYLVEKESIKLDIEDEKGRTALHNACWGPAGGVQGKIRKNVKLDEDQIHNKLFIQEESTCTPNNFKLYDCPQAVEILLKKGHPVDYRDLKGNTPLAIATSSNALSSIPILIRFGANINSQNNLGESIIWVAAWYGQLDPIKLLLEQYKADPFITNNDGISPLEAALINNNWDCFDYLLRQFYIKNDEALITFIIKLPQQLLDIEQTMYIQKKAIAQEIQLFEQTIKKSIEYLVSERPLDFYFQIIQEQIKTNVNKEQGSKCVAYLSFKVLPQLVSLSNFITLYQFFSAINCIILEQLREEIIIPILQLQKFEFLEKILEPESSLKNTNIKVNISEKFFYEYIKSNDLSSNHLTYLIFSFDIDIFRYRNTNDNQTFMHLFIKQRKTELIINLLNLVQGLEVTNIQIKKNRNKYLESQNFPNKEEISQFLALNSIGNQINCLDLALILNYQDLNMILSQFQQKFLQQISISNRCIPKYQYKIVKYNSYEATHSRLQFLQDLQKQEDLSYMYQIINEQDKNQLINLKKYADQKSLKPFNLVSSLEDLQKFLLEIQFHQIFGIDLEYFCEQKDESFGFVCTIQISTVSSDFVIDAITLRKEIPVYLKDLFSQEKYIKIFHSCSNDLKWLKNDFDLDCVNIFDTDKAQRILDQKQSNYSLASLAQQHISYTMNKGFQTADWRIRPLPFEMLEYAKTDANILVWLFHVMKTQLEQKKLLHNLAYECIELSYKKIQKIKLKKLDINFEI